MAVGGRAIRAFEWLEFSLASACVLFLVAACCYVVPKISQATFNSIWKTRLALLLSALALAASQLLPLQLWDPQYGAVRFLPKGFRTYVLCKVFTVVALGICQPYMLFLAAWMCSYGIRDPAKLTTWRKPALYSFLCMLPFAALQVLSAWWSSWLESTLDDDDELGSLPFATYSVVPCPGQGDVTKPTGSSASKAAAGRDPATCISCKYTFCSVLTHLVLTVAFIALIVVYGGALLQRCANASLRARIRHLCFVLPALQILQTLAAAVTVVKRQPHTWVHESAKVAALVCVIALILAVSLLLVICPLRSASRALQFLSKVCGDADSAPLAFTRISHASEDRTLLPVRHGRTTSNSSELAAFSAAVDDGSMATTSQPGPSTAGPSRPQSGPSVMPKGSSSTVHRGVPENYRRGATGDACSTASVASAGLTSSTAAGQAASLGALQARIGIVGADPYPLQGHQSRELGRVCRSS